MKEKRCKGTGLSGLCCILVAGAALLGVSGSARAGFDWTPPPVTEPAPSVPPVLALPSSPVETESLSGGEESFIMDALPMVDAPVLAEPVSPVPIRTAVPAIPAVPVTPPPAPVARTVYEDAVGFGNDIPMAMALRQVVPPRYSFSFDPGINQGARVSWNGGKPWNEVLDDSLRPLDLRAVVTGENVWIRKAWTDAGTDMATPLPMDASSLSPVPIAPMPPPVAVQDAAPVFMPPVPVAAPVSVPVPQPVAAPSAVQSYPRHVPNPVSATAVTGREMMSPSSLPVPLAPPVMSAPQPVVAAAPAPAPAVAASVMDPLDIVFWQAEAGESLRSVLGRWAGGAHVAVLWNSPYDYILPFPVQMHGTFPDAVSLVLTGFSAADPRPLGQLHPNLPNGPSALVIENYSVATN